MLQEFKEYVNNNPNGYWFKAKWYGWGWVPVTWQGWAVTLGYIALVLALALTIDERSSVKDVSFTFLLPVVILTACLIRICYAKGEKPGWHWGVPKDNH
ncbi:MAG: hypothetical protein U0487_02865 [Patescibacteria group bacterium]